MINKKEGTKGQKDEKGTAERGGVRARRDNDTDK